MALSVPKSYCSSDIKLLREKPSEFSWRPRRAIPLADLGQRKIWNIKPVSYLIFNISIDPPLQFLSFASLQFGVCMGRLSCDLAALVSMIGKRSMRVGCPPEWLPELPGVHDLVWESVVWCSSTSPGCIRNSRDQCKQIKSKKTTILAIFLEPKGLLESGISGPQLIPCSHGDPILYIPFDRT